ncbi:MAG: hypothetical protein ACRCT1_09990 [Microcoleaceae cyanobacterium]
MFGAIASYLGQLSWAIKSRIRANLNNLQTVNISSTRHDRVIGRNWLCPCAIAIVRKIKLD